MSFASDIRADIIDYDKNDNISLSSNNNPFIISEQQTLTPNPEVLSEKNTGATDVLENKEHRWCSGNCPKEFIGKCEFSKFSSVVLDEENNSDILKRNFCKKYGITYERKNRIICSYNNLDFMETFHHIIPGNQSYKRNEYLLKLGNFYGYSINNADNCKVLLKPSVEQSGNMKLEDRISTYYLAMSKEKIQIHVGGHSFENNIDKLSEYENKFRTFIKNTFPSYRCCSYAKLVDAKLTVVQEELMKKNECTCRMINKEADAIKFSNAINTVSRRIGMEIDKFNNIINFNSRYCVSFYSLAYALNIKEEDLCDILR